MMSRYPFYDCHPLRWYTEFALQDLHGIGHKLPLCVSIKKLEFIEVRSLVQLAANITKDGVTQLAVTRPCAKRKPDITVKDLEAAVCNAPKQCSNLGVTVCGPAKASRLLDMHGGDRERWLEDARVAAIAGSCPRSSAEMKSAVRAFTVFASKAQKLALPPTVDLLLSWSCLFRCSGTFNNYVSSLRGACQIAGISTDGMHSHLLKKASQAIDKRRGYIARSPMFIGIDILKKMMAMMGDNPTYRTRCSAMGFLTTYVFMLRMPSECLPIRVSTGKQDEQVHQAVISISANELTLRLKRRKNKEGGSVLMRKCWCNSCKITCPVHVLGPFLLACGPGAQPFAMHDARSALQTLRGWLRVLKIEQAANYRTHDLRRGHARDMVQSGARLGEILRAGEWRSAAFLSYLDKDELECNATLEAHLGESSDEEAEHMAAGQLAGA